jgi:ribosomal protein S18 acetylase RimI-like enzyme
MGVINLKISHIEDKNLIACCVDKRNYEIINQVIENECNNYDFFIEEQEKKVGYKIYKINQLSEIYGFSVYAVSFIFKDISNAFNEEDNVLIGRAVKDLYNKLKELKGYHILKVPTNNTMLINQYNIYFKNIMFTGGTVCYYTKAIKEKTFDEDGLKICILKRSEKEKYQERLIKLGRESFEDYFGQYHISHITRDKAPLIYEDWVKDYISTDNEDIIVAKYNDDIIGFLAIDYADRTIEMVLSAVDSNYRGLKVYERMIRFGVELGIDSKKILTLSTQFDNYLVQRAWINIGFKPYYSFYLYHISNI